MLSLQSRVVGFVLSLLAVGLAVLLAGCGGKASSGSEARTAKTPARHSSTTTSQAARGSGATNVANEALAFLFPRNGAEYASGTQLTFFEEAQVNKLTSACLKAQGLPGARAGFLPPPYQYVGIEGLLNLPLVERDQALGGSVRVHPPKDPTQGMSKAETAAYNAALAKCGAKSQRVLAPLQSGTIQALSDEWLNIISQVFASAPVQKLNREATACAADTAYPGRSVQGEIATIANKEIPLNERGEYAAGRAVEKAGVRVLIRCFATEVTTAERILTRRRATFFAANAPAIDRFEANVNRAVANLDHTRAHSPQ